MLASQLLLLLLTLFVPGSNPPKEVCSELPNRCIEIVTNNSVGDMHIDVVVLQGGVQALVQPVREC